MNKGKFVSEPILYRTLKPLVIFLFKLVFRPKITGKENIPQNGAAILAGNHTEFWDCFAVIASTRRCVHFMAKSELFSNPFTSRFFTAAGLISVNRKQKDKNALVSAETYLKKGCIVGIFPEGTTNKTTAPLLEFKLGSVKMAHDTNTVIVPFTINGKYVPFKNSIEIIFQKPYRTATDDLKNENRILREKVLTNLQKQGVNNV